MPECVELECRILPGAPGWASCSIRIGDKSLTIGAFSHVLSEGIDDLVRAATAVVLGAWDQAFSMDEEPEPRWQWTLRRRLLHRPRRFELEVTIKRIDDVVAEAGDQAFRAVCDPDDFGRAVLVAMKRLIASEAPESLRERWSHFPMRAIAALEAALAIPDPAD
jgi:hypothetical protein